MIDIRATIADVERSKPLPPGEDERFSGYGVMGLPFSSGHVLALRRFPVTSVGPGYTAVWLRRPSGSWVIYTDVAAEISCPRYFGSALESTSVHPIALEWTGGNTFTVTIGDGIGLVWEVELGATLVTRMMSNVAGAVPDAMWHRKKFLKVMGAAAGPALGVGHLGLTGVVPNRQSFRASPKKVWSIAGSRATLAGQDLGTLEPLRVQSRLGDFWIPQRGIFMIGSSAFDRYDPSRHLPAAGR